MLIFPDLNSGNIAYKLTQYMAGAKAIGPLPAGIRQTDQRLVARRLGRRHRGDDGNLPGTGVMNREE